MARLRPLQQVGKAGQAVQHTAAQANRTLADVRELIEELQNGVTIVLVRKENSCTLMEFLSGQGKEFPIGIRVDVREEPPKPEPVK